MGLYYVLLSGADVNEQNHMFFVMFCYKLLLSYNSYVDVSIDDLEKQKKRQRKPNKTKPVINHKVYSLFPVMTKTR